MFNSFTINSGSPECIKVTNSICLHKLISKNNQLRKSYRADNPKLNANINGNCLSNFCEKAIGRLYEDNSFNKANLIKNLEKIQLQKKFELRQLLVEKRKK